MTNKTMAISGKRGFTLIELMIVIVILAILTAIAIPVFSGNAELAKKRTDEANLKILNAITGIYKAEEPIQDPFLDNSKSSVYLIGVLVDSGFLSSAPIPKQKDAEFKWDFSNGMWLLSDGNGNIEIIYTPGEHFSLNPSTKTIENYDGKGGTALVIPKEINGIVVTQIGQSAMYHGYLTNTWDKLTGVILPDTIQKISGNAFHSNALTSVIIPDSVTFLGANAFYGNLLTSVSLGTGLTEIKGGVFAGNRITELVLPPEIKIVGDGAFQSNAITKITIGENVTLTKTTSLGNYGNSFNTFYNNEDKAAGTYIYVNGVWQRS